MGTDLVLHPQYHERKKADPGPVDAGIREQAPRLHPQLDPAQENHGRYAADPE